MVGVGRLCPARGEALKMRQWFPSSLLIRITREGFNNAKSQGSISGLRTSQREESEFLASDAYVANVVPVWQSPSEKFQGKRFA